MQQRSPVGMPLLPPGGGMESSEPWHASRYSGTQFFTYEVDYGIGSTAALSPDQANLDATFQIQNDSDFFWLSLAAFGLNNTSTAPTFATDLLVAGVIQITDIATGRQYDNTPPELGGFHIANPAGSLAVPFADLTGTSGIPFLVPACPVLWERNSVLRVSVNDEALAGGANGVYAVTHLSFHGIKAFY